MGLLEEGLEKEGFLAEPGLERERKGQPEPELPEEAAQSLEVRGLEQVWRSVVGTNPDQSGID